MASVNTSCSLSVIIVLLLKGFLSQACIFGRPNQNCTYTCNCADDGDCDVLTGACDGGCRRGEPRPPGNESIFDWRGPGCRIGNVALNKLVNQSGVVHWPAPNSVDGKLQAINGDLRHCTHTDPHAAEFAWWYVDLGGNFYINNISIFNRRHMPSSMRTGHFNIRVGNSSDITSNALCTYYEGPVPPEESVTLSCDSDMIGRYVSLQRTGGQEPNIINICEVVVMGHEYVTANSPNCLSDSDNVVGCLNCSGFEPPLCTTPCSRGQYGINCNASCSTHRCLYGSDTCDGLTGECPDGCQMWYTFNSCSKEIKVVELGEETKLTVINVRTNKVTLRWRSAGDISPALAPNYGYLVQYQMQNATEFIPGTNITHNADKEEHSATVRGLEFNRLYDFQVSAYRLWEGVSEVSTMPSSMATVKTLCKAPEPVTIVNLRSPTSTPPFTVYVQWQMPSSGCDSISSIQVLYRQVDTDTWMTHNVSDPAGSTSNVTDIAESGRLDVRIRVVNNAHLVSESTTHSVTLGARNPTNSGPNIGIIVGPVAGGLLLIVIVFVIVVVCVRRSMRQQLSTLEYDHLQMKTRNPSTSAQQDLTGGDATEHPEHTIYETIIVESDATHQGVNATDPINEPETTAVILVSQLKTYMIQLSGDMTRESHDGKIEICDGFARQFDVIRRVDLGQGKVDHSEIRSIRKKFGTGNKSDDQAEEFRDIGASYITGYPKKTKHYIATQGPLKETMEAFWSVVWAQQINSIAMLNNLKEGGETECQIYWPESMDKKSALICGKYQITLLLSEVYGDYAYRRLSLKYKRAEREIHQIQFLAWDDQKCLNNNFPLLAFRRRILCLPCNPSGPLIVHSRAGDGRMGILIALDYLLNQAKCEGQVDVFSCASRLQMQRKNIIQSKHEYKILYQALLEGIETQIGEPGVQKDDFVMKYSKLWNKSENNNQNQLREEYQLMCHYKPLTAIHSASVTNNTKNRFRDVTPVDRYRPKLTTPTSEDQDYINAVFVDSFQMKNAMILTQMPLPNTVVDFWRLVYDHKCDTIVMLNEMDSTDVTIATYWPVEEFGRKSYGPLTVEHISSELGSNSQIAIRTFKVSEDKRMIGQQTVRQFQLLGWSKHDNCPCDPDHFIDLIDNVTESRQQQTNGVTIIHCMNGAERSGLFAAASFMLDVMKAEKKVDVMLAARYITSRRPQAINTLEQYEFLYELAKLYISGCRIYDNI